jgi:hypothetical protein
MPAERDLTWDAAVMVLRWWEAQDKENIAAELFVTSRPGGAGPVTWHADVVAIGAFLNHRLARKHYDKVVPGIMEALEKLKAKLKGKSDVPEYIRLGLEEALKVAGSPAQVAPSYGSCPEVPETSPSAAAAKNLAKDQRDLRERASALVLTVARNWPAHGTDEAREAVTNLYGDKSSDNYQAGFYRVLRWAAPSRRDTIGARIGQAFVRFSPHTVHRVPGPFAYFNLYYRPRTFSERKVNLRSTATTQVYGEPLRTSDGVVMPIQSHMYFIGQEHVEAPPSQVGSLRQTSERRTSGYPLIVSCALPDFRYDFQGIVLRQTDSDQQVLASRVLFQKLEGQSFGSTIAERYQKFREHAHKNAALYEVETDGTVPGLTDGPEVLALLDDLRNVEPIADVPASFGRFAITLPNP